MNIQDVCNYLNFWVNKVTGAWYTIPELIEIIDRGQMALFEDLRTEYATDQNVKDALSPFMRRQNFSTQVSGLVRLADETFLDLLTIQTWYMISDRVVYHDVKLYNDDELANALNSQTDPVSETNPIGEAIAVKAWLLYPARSSGAYEGTIRYFARPVKPVFAYTIISGVVIVYDHSGSTQLEWRESELNRLMLKALMSAGINLNSEELIQFGQMKTSDNYIGINRL